MPTHIMNCRLLTGEERRGQRLHLLCPHLYSEPQVQAHNGHLLTLYLVIVTNFWCLLMHSSQGGYHLHSLFQ